MGDAMRDKGKPTYLDLWTENERLRKAIVAAHAVLGEIHSPLVDRDRGRVIQAWQILNNEVPPATPWTEGKP